VYGLRAIERLTDGGIATHVIVSAEGERVARQETGRGTSDTFSGFAGNDLVTVHANDDLSAPVASGSFLHAGMIVSPCSMGTLGRIASGVSMSLIDRAADVSLKERRPLILVARETPLSAIHLENMLTVTRAGAVVLPPVPAFYAKPRSIDDLIELTVSRVLDLVGLPRPDAFRWGEQAHLKE
jgi:4-hydroxy-3-polyprenylbenzoate decarboxylase